MKSIISRMGEMKTGNTTDENGEYIDASKVETALKSVGVSLRDSQGQFRNLDTVIGELGAKWSTLDSATQRYLGTIIAGNRQQSRFLALMENYDRYVEIQEAAMDSEDASILQYSKTLDSLQSKLNQISNSFQQFYMSIANGPVIGGVLDFLNTLISGFGKLGTITSIFNIANIINGIKTIASLLLNLISPFFTQLLTAYKNSKSQFVNISREIGTAAGKAEVDSENEAKKKAQEEEPKKPTGGLPKKPTGGLPKKPTGGLPKEPTGDPPVAKNSKWAGWVSIAGAGLSMGGSYLAGTGNVVAGSLVSGLGNIASGVGTGFMAGGSVGAVIGGLIGGLSSLSGIISAFNNQLEEEISNLKQETEDKNIERVEAKSKADDLAKYIEKWTELSKHQHDSTEAMQEYLDVSNEIAEAYPQYVSYIDESGNAIVNMSTATEYLNTVLGEAATKTLEWAKTARETADKQTKQATDEVTPSAFDIADLSVSPWPWQSLVGEEISSYTAWAKVDSSLSGSAKSALDVLKRKDSSVWESFRKGLQTKSVAERIQLYKDKFDLEEISEYNNILSEFTQQLSEATDRKEQKYWEGMIARLQQYTKGVLGKGALDKDGLLSSAFADYDRAVYESNAVRRTTAATLYSAGYNSWRQGIESDDKKLIDTYGLSSLMSYQAINDPRNFSTEKIIQDEFLADLQNGTYQGKALDVYQRMIENFDEGSKAILAQFAESTTSVSMSDIVSLYNNQSKEVDEQIKAAMDNIINMWYSENGLVYETLMSHLPGDSDFQTFQKWKESEAKEEATYADYIRENVSTLQNTIPSLDVTIATQLANRITEIEEITDDKSLDNSNTKAAAQKYLELLQQLLNPGSELSKAINNITDVADKQAVYAAILADQDVDWEENIIKAFANAGVTPNSSVLTQLSTASFVNLNTAIASYYNTIVESNEALVDTIENGSKGISPDAAKKQWKETGIDDIDWTEAYEYDEEIDGLVLSAEGRKTIQDKLTKDVEKYTAAHSQVKDTLDNLKLAGTAFTWQEDREQQKAQLPGFLAQLGIEADSDLYKNISDQVAVAIADAADTRNVVEIVADYLQNVYEDTNDIIIEYYRHYAQDIIDASEKETANALLEANDEFVAAYQKINSGKTVAEAQQLLDDLGITSISVDNAFAWNEVAESFVGTTALYEKIAEKYQEEIDNANAEISRNDKAQQAITWLKQSQAVDQLNLTPANYIEKLGLSQFNFDESTLAELSKAVSGKTNSELYNAVIEYFTSVNTTATTAVVNMLEQQAEYWEKQSKIATAIRGASDAATKRKTSLEGFSSIYDTAFVEYAQGKSYLDNQSTYNEFDLTKAAKQAGYIVDKITGEMLETPQSILSAYVEAFGKQENWDASTQAQYDADVEAWQQAWVETLKSYTGEITKEQIANLQKHGFDTKGLIAGGQWTNELMAGIVEQWGGDGNEWLTPDNAAAINNSQAKANHLDDFNQSINAAQESFWNNLTDQTVSSIEELARILKNEADFSLNADQIATAQTALNTGYDAVEEFLEQQLDLKLDANLMKKATQGSLSSTLESIGNLGKTLGDTDMSEAEKIAEVTELFAAIGKDVEYDDVKGWLEAGGTYDTLFTELQQRMEEYFGNAFDQNDLEKMKAQTLAYIRDQTVEDNSEITQIFSDALAGNLSNIDFQKIVVGKLGGNKITPQQTAEGLQLANDDVLRLAAKWAAQEPLQTDAIISGLQENGILDDYAEVNALIEEGTENTEKWGDAQAEVLALVKQTKIAMEQDVNNTALEGDIFGTTDDKFSDFVDKVSEYSSLLTSVNKNQDISFASAQKLLSLMAQHKELGQSSEQLQEWTNQLTSLMNLAEGGTINFSSFLGSIGMTMGDFNETCVDEIKKFAENRISYLDGMIALLEGLEKLQEGLDTTQIEWPTIDFSSNNSEETYKAFINAMNEEVDLQKQLFGSSWKDLFPNNEIDFGTFMAQMGGFNKDNFSEAAYNQYKEFFTSDAFKSVAPEIYFPASGEIDIEGLTEAYSNVYATFLKNKSDLTLEPEDYGTPSIQTTIELIDSDLGAQVQEAINNAADGKTVNIPVTGNDSDLPSSVAAAASAATEGVEAKLPINTDDSGIPQQVKDIALTIEATNVSILVTGTVDEDGEQEVKDFRTDAGAEITTPLSADFSPANDVVSKWRESITGDTSTKQAIGADFSIFDLTYPLWKSHFIETNSIEIPLLANPDNATDTVNKLKDNAGDITFGTNVNETEKQTVTQWTLDMANNTLTISFSTQIAPDSLEALNTELDEYSAAHGITCSVAWGTDGAAEALQNWLSGLKFDPIVISVVLMPAENGDFADASTVKENENAQSFKKNAENDTITTSIGADISKAANTTQSFKELVENDIAIIPIGADDSEAKKTVNQAKKDIEGNPIVQHVLFKLGGSINSSYGTGMGGGDVNSLLMRRYNPAQIVSYITGNAYAAGTTSLVGELGPELAVYDGQYHLLGQHGAEFVDLPGNAVIFNHKQTEGILQGRPGVRGKVLNGGEAFVAGTGPAYDIGSAINALKMERSMWQGILNQLTFDQLMGSGGGGGGGDNTIKATIQDLTEWYNLMRQIEDLEIQINNLEAERENITDGHKYLRNLRETQELLQAQMITHKTLLKYQEAQRKLQAEHINENEIWSQFFTVDDEGLLQYVMGNETNGGKGTLSVLDQMNKMSGEEQVKFLKKIGYTFTDNDGKEYEDEELVQKFYEEAQTQIDKYDDLRDTVAETTQTLENLEGEINDITQEIRENQEDLEQDVYDALVNKMETEIEDLTEQMDLLKKANDAYINGLSEALEKERDLYTENQSTADREQLQRELSLLRRSGGSASKIASLEEQLDSTLQDEYFAHQQETIDSIQEASDKQVEALNKQIELQQESLDYQKEAGVLWTKVYEILSGEEPDILAFLQGNSSDFNENSKLVQEDALKDWSKKIGIFKEDSEWGHEFNSEEANDKFDTEAWNDAIVGEEKQQIYNALTADRQADIREHFATAYANAKTEGQTDEEAYDTAREAIYKRLYASYSEQANETGLSEADRLVNGSDTSGKGWVQVKYGNGLGGTSAVAVGSRGYWHYTIDEYKTSKPKVGYKTVNLQGIDGKPISNNKGRISLNQNGSFTGVTRGTVVIYVDTSTAKTTQKTTKAISDADTNTSTVGAGTSSGMSRSTLSSNQSKRELEEVLLREGIIPAKLNVGGYILQDGVPAILHKGEGVFTAKQTSALMNLVNNYQKLAANNMGSTLLSSFADTAKNYSTLGTTSTTQTSSITIDPGAVVIQVEQLNDKYDVDSLATDVFNKITNIASKATNRGVNRR